MGARIFTPIGKRKPGRNLGISVGGKRGRSGPYIFRGKQFPITRRRAYRRDGGTIRPSERLQEPVDILTWSRKKGAVIALKGGGAARLNEGGGRDDRLRIAKREVIRHNQEEGGGKNMPRGDSLWL